VSRPELEALSQIARDAGRGILRIYGQEFSVEYKGPGDPVTAADREANTLICQRLQAEFPGVAIVAEESASETYRGYQQERSVFFVDPLDGTREFVARNGQFVVMIGLLVEDIATMGVVYAPVTDTLWCGARGIAAYRVDADGSERPIRVGRVTRPEDARITVSRSRRSSRLERALRATGSSQVIPMGSAGLKGSHVADDSADVYLALGQAGKHWDACAMDAIVSAAGGRVSDARGRALNYRSEHLELEDGILAANPGLHAALLSRIAEPAA
jgi:3'(2'), 5'-bisphosphate nucleotidase